MLTNKRTLTVVNNPHSNQNLAVTVHGTQAVIRDYIALTGVNITVSGGNVTIVPQPADVEKVEPGDVIGHSSIPGQYWVVGVPQGAGYKLLAGTASLPGSSITGTAVQVGKKANVIELGSVTADSYVELDSATNPGAPQAGNDGSFVINTASVFPTTLPFFELTLTRKLGFGSTVAQFKMVETIDANLTAAGLASKIAAWINGNKDIKGSATLSGTTVSVTFKLPTPVFTVLCSHPSAISAIASGSEPTGVAEDLKKLYTGSFQASGIMSTIGSLYTGSSVLLDGKRYRVVHLFIKQPVSTLTNDTVNINENIVFVNNDTPANASASVTGIKAAFGL